MKLMGSWFKLACIAALGISCGENEKIIDSHQPGIVVLRDQSFGAEHGKIENTRMKLNRLRVWKRNPNSEFASSTSGDAPDQDSLTAELWFQLEGETQERYRKISGLRQDQNGWLFPSEVLGGLNHNPDIKGPFSDYQRKAEEGFVLNRAPFFVNYERGTHIVVDSDKQIIQQNVVHDVRFQFTDENWPEAFSSLQNTVFTSESNLLGDAGYRVQWEKNEKTETGYAQTGLAACVVETRNGGNSGNGSFNAPQLVFQEIELGDYVYSRSGDMQAPPSASLTTAECGDARCGTYAVAEAGNDDELWISTREYYHLVGINISGAPQIRVHQTNQKPFYLNRQLPSSLRESAPRISGIETLVRKCNDIAVQNASSVAAHPILGNSRGDAPAKTILPSIGFKIIANAKGGSNSQPTHYASPLMRFCDAMPDRVSPSADLDRKFSAIDKTEGELMTGVKTCGSSATSSFADPKLQGLPLGAVLDSFVAPGVWSGRLGRNNGAALAGSVPAAEAPAFRTTSAGKSDF
jgi:hypothetical protein